MLVLTIRNEDTIEMQEGRIKVAILSIRRNKVTIGIEAPEEIDIRRGQKLVRELDKENETKE